MKKILLLLLLSNLSAAAASVDLLSASTITNLITARIAAATNLAGILNSIEKYGAMGDGIVDDYLALTNVVISTSGEGGGSILLGAKTYRISQTATFSNLRSIIFEGSGRGRTVIKFDNSGGTVAGFNFASTTNLDGVVFRNLTIEGGNDSDTSPWDLVLFGDGWSNTVFENVEVRNARHSGIRWSATTYGTNCLIDNCYVHHINSSNMTAQAGGAIMGSPVDLNIRNTTVDMYGVTNRSTTHAIYLSGIRNFGIYGCTLRGINARLHVYAGIGSSRDGVAIGNRFLNVPSITLADVLGMVFLGNVMDNSSLKFSCDDGIVTGNIINNGTIQVLGALGQSFLANSFSNQVGSAAFTIDSTSPVVIKGNTINSDDGINLNQGSGHLIDGNVVKIFNAINGTLHLTGSVSNVISRNNYYYSSGGGTPYLLKNEGTGTNCWSYYDTFDCLSTNQGFNTPKYPTGLAYP